MQPSDLWKRSDLLSSVLVVAHLALVFGPLLVAATLPPDAAWIACLLCFGGPVHGVLDLLHEWAHDDVFSVRATLVFRARDDCQAAFPA